MSMQSTAHERPAGPWVPEWSFGDRLRKVRRETGMTQRGFAALLGVPEPRYAAWEADRATPSNVVAVAKTAQLATGVPASWLLGVDIDPERPRQDSNLQPTDNSGGVIDLTARLERFPQSREDADPAPVILLPTATAR